MNHAKVAHHLGMLGLDSNRSRQYLGTEIKVSFGTRAMEYHPDHNQSSNKHGEVKFKQILESYQAFRTHYKIK
jgi:DnaJ-class molecular chaperone